MIEVFGDRQTGKTHTVMLASLFRAAYDGAIVVWTSETLKVSKHTLERMKKQMPPYAYTSGYSPRMHISFPGSGKVIFVARNSPWLRGMTADYLVWDDYTPKDHDYLVAAYPVLAEHDDVQCRVTVIARADD